MDLAHASFYTNAPTNHTQSAPPSRAARTGSAFLDFLLFSFSKQDRPAASLAALDRSSPFGSRSIMAPHAITESNTQMRRAQRMHFAFHHRRHRVSSTIPNLAPPRPCTMHLCPVSIDSLASLALSKSTIINSVQWFSKPSVSYSISYWDMFHSDDAA